MNSIFLTGVLGSFLLVLGAAWPTTRAGKKPYQSIKNWLFAIGGYVMLAYAVLGYLGGGPIFFIFLEALIGIASIMMFLSVDDRIDAVVIGISGIGFVIWSLTLFEGYNTVIFIFGLVGIGLGYAFDDGTLRRDIALTVGSLLVALFSYLESSWIFFWLNIFFALFSGYYLFGNTKKSAPIPSAG
jgi:hypothetical protein